MAHEITELTRSVAPSADYPWGDIADSGPSSQGTLANRLMFTDMLQTMQRAMALGLITPNGSDDNTANGYQLAQAFGLEAWRSGGTPTATAVGGGSITIAPGDVAYNKYQLAGRTFEWHIQLQTVTVSGTVTSIYFDPPAEIAAANLDWSKNSGNYIGFINGAPDLRVILGGPTATGQITIVPVGGGNFPTGTDDQSYDIVVRGEVFENP